MKIGDLVNFYSSFEPFSEVYESKNPGVVLFVNRSAGWGHKQGMAEVMWSNKEVTTEHLSYLKVVNENHR
jgi:hypothetical protein